MSLYEAKRLLILGDILSARKLYSEILNRNPDNIEALHGISLTHFREKNDKEAIRYLLRAVQRDANDPEIHYSLGIVFQHAKEEKKAVGAFQKAIEGFEKQSRRKKTINACLQLAALYIRQGNLNDANVLIQKILKVEPRQIEALKIQAQIAIGQLRYHFALETLEKLPVSPATLEALKTEVFLLKGDYRNALECAKRFEQLTPEDPLAYRLVGECYLRSQQLDRAIKAYEEGVTLDPCDCKLLSRLLALYVRCCRWEERKSIGQRLKNLAANDTCGECLQEIQPTIAILTGFTNQQLQAIAKVRAKRIENEAAPLRSLLNFRHQPKNRKNKLKIGYLSSDFYTHATAHLMLDLFALHNREQFEIFAYSYGKNDQSSYRKKIEEDCDHFVEIDKMTDREAAEKIHEEGINILVDLKGHIIDNRLKILALRPSPLQVHYLGYPGTIGARFVDYLIADKFVIPRTERKYYSEAVAYMPKTYQINMADKTVSKQIPDKKKFGIPSDAFVFSCFNQSDKLDTETVLSWMQIMRCVPKSVLWIWGNYDGLKQKLIDLGQKHSITKERFIIAPTQPNPEHLARLPLADLFLDTFLYNAHTSCSDAIRMGLPLLTRPGCTFASRVAASLLKQVKCSNLIATSTEDYISKAIAFANFPETLKAVRLKLQNNRQASQLYDSAFFTRQIEMIYQKMWETYAAGKPPADIIA